MFEKEAEEWVKNNLHSTEEDYIRAYKDGAEFGFQKGIKAKINTTTISDCPIKDEWHYVKDGDLPKTKGNYLVAWERTHHIEEFGEWGFDVDLFNIEEEYFEGTGDYAIAWKEIVSPIVSPNEASE